MQARIKELEEELDLERSARNKVTAVCCFYNPHIAK